MLAKAIPRGRPEWFQAMFRLAECQWRLGQAKRALATEITTRFHDAAAAAQAAAEFDRLDRLLDQVRDRRSGDQDRSRA